MSAMETYSPEKTPGQIGALNGRNDLIMGSRTVFLRPRDDDNGPDPDDDTGGTPLPAVSAPDFAVQTSPCLETFGKDVPGKVIEALQEEFGADADIRIICLNDRSNIGIWTTRSMSTSQAEARDRGLKNVSILEPGETFAIWINGSFIKTSGTKAWNSAPKRLNHDGNADDDGSVHLTSFKIEFASPNKVKTIVSGYDTAPWPDVDFTMTITDTFSIDNGIVRVSSDSDLDTDVPFWADVFTGMLTFLGFVLSPLFFIPAGLLIAQRVIIVVADPPDSNSGAGGIAASRIPREIYIENGDKVVCIYSRINVDRGGIIAAGSGILTDREPTCRISGPTQIVGLSSSESATRTFFAFHDDLRGDLQFSWTGDGGVASTNKNRVDFRFDLSDMEAGDAAQKQIKVHITDEDGLTAEDTMTVTVFKGSPDPSLPPVCRVKPWLPQCNPV